MTENNANAPKAKITVTISQLLDDLKKGIDRKSQAKKYGLSVSQITDIYKHPKLVNKKVHRPLSTFVELIDDTVEDGTEAPEVATEGVIEAPVEATEQKDEDAKW